LQVSPELRHGSVTSRTSSQRFTPGPSVWWTILIKDSKDGLLKGWNAPGLRKLAATRLATNGATAHELNAVSGWTGSKMALHHVALANRAHLAAGGAAKNKKPEAVVEAIQDFFD
jgi:hypothetical protein